MSITATPVPVRSCHSVRVVGAVCAAGALVAWAWTLTVLTPHMPRMHEIAPTPGGDGELFLWVAELRWGAILLAALGLLAVATRPAAGIAGAAALVVADGFVERSGPAGKLVPVLLLGLVALAGAWAAARTVPAGDPDDEVVRWRLTAIGVTGVASGPVLLVQGTPAVNHPFLPASMGATHATVVGLLIVLGATATFAARPRSRPLVGLLVGAVLAVPFVVLGRLTGGGVENEVTSIGAAAAPVLAVAALLVARPGGLPRTWALAAVAAAVVAAPLVLYALAMFSTIPAELLFSVAGTGYPADGLSVLPCTVAAVLLGLRLVSRRSVPAG